MLIYCSKCLDGKVSASESVQRVSGWCEDIRRKRNGRPGADFLKHRREVRVSPLQLFKCPKGNPGGTAEMFFRPESL